MSGSDIFRMHGNALEAVLALESLASSPTSYQIGRFANCELGLLTWVLDDLKFTRPSEELAALADRIREVFEAFQSRAAQCCRQLGYEARGGFRRMGEILHCLLRRGRHAYPDGAQLPVREADIRCRVALMDRLADALRALFTWLRDLCRQVEDLLARPVGPVLLGASAARFVEKADTRENVLVLRLDNGRYELFNMTDALWALVMPLLVTPHPQGHARLKGRPQGLLTRHDANGDEVDGDLRRLKGYIHPVGLGRGGNGKYFLAPYARRVNTVDS